MTTYTITLTQNEVELLEKATDTLYPHIGIRNAVALEELRKCTLKIAAIRGLERILEIMGTKEVA